MKPSVYIETSVISYLTAQPSRDLVVAACQQTTREWWDDCRERFSLYISARVVAEASQGDPAAAARRLSVLEGIPVITISDEMRSLAEQLMTLLGLPENAIEDALHIATAVASGMDYLLSWNCRHIAHA